MRFIVGLFLLVLIGCNSCSFHKTTEEPPFSPAPALATAPEEPKSPPPPPPPPKRAKAGGPTRSFKMEEVFTPSHQLPVTPVEKKKMVKKAVEPKSAALPSTPINVQHPDHFYSKVWCQVSITLGSPLPVEVGTINIVDEVPKAAAYSVSLRGEPADQFEIKQGEQIISAPTTQFPSSSVYFDVRPLSPGKKLLIYQVKARLSENDPGIGLPEVTRDIVVEINNQSRWIFIKSLFPYIFSALGAGISAIIGIFVTRWFSNKY